MNVARTTIVALSAATLYGCASSGRLNTSSGKPEVRVSRSWLKRLPVAIASYNIDRGRHLDEATRGELVTFDGVKSSDGSVEVRSKTVYDFVDSGDSVLLSSRRLLTTDLDDEDASEALDQPTLDEQQDELQQIVRRLAEQMAAETKSTAPNNAQGDHGQ